jgi:hypothetical protein
VTPDLHTLLTALYVESHDHVIPRDRRGWGRPKKLSGAELGVPGDDAGAAGRPVGASLAAAVLHEARAPVLLACRLSSGLHGSTYPTSVPGLHPTASCKHVE